MAANPRERIERLSIEQRKWNTKSTIQLNNDVEAELLSFSLCIDANQNLNVPINTKIKKEHGGSYPYFYSKVELRRGVHTIPLRNYSKQTQP